MSFTNGFISAAIEKKPERPAVQKPTRAQRLSLPQTIESSTKVNVEKAQRRLSARFRSKDSNHVLQQSSSISSRNSLSSCENRPPHYSPPRTRSTKKKLKSSETSPLLVCKRSGVLLEFSPPDQEENRRREDEFMKRKEEERARRISRARQNGQLLIYDATDLSLVDENMRLKESSPRREDPPDAQLSSSASTLTEAFSLSVKESATNEEVANELKSIKELILANNSKQSSEEILIHRDALAKQESLNSHNAKLVTEMVEKMGNLTEAHTAEKTRLELQLEQTQANLQRLEGTKCMLEEQLQLLKSGENEQSIRINQLISEIKERHELLTKQNKDMELMKQQSEMEKEELALECEKLEATNIEMKRELKAAKASNDDITIQLREYHSKTEQFEKITIPQLHKEIENQIKLVAETQSIARDLKERLKDCEYEIEKRKQEVEMIRVTNDKDLSQYQSKNEEYNGKLGELSMKISQKDDEIARLSQELLKLQKDLIDEQQNAKKAKDVFDEIENKWSKENMELSKALEKSFHDNETLEKMKVSLQDELKSINDQNYLLLQANERTDAEKEQAIDALAQLRRDLENERSLREQVSSSQEEERLMREIELKQVEKERKLLEHECRLRTTLEEKNHELEILLQETIKERDMARENMLGFDERETVLYNKLREGDRIRREQHSRLMQLMGNIRVFVRVRPPLPGEAEEEKRRAEGKCKRKISTEEENIEEDETAFKFPGLLDDSKVKTNASDDLTKNIVEIYAPWEDRGGLKDRRKRHRFGFDSVFTPNHSQKDVWDATEPLVQSAIDGFNVTIFAYGQTGSGKTHTMLGDEANPGLIGRAVEKIFAAKHDIELLSKEETEITISVELLEVYNEKVRDLLASTSARDVKVTSEEVVGNIVVSTPTQDQVLRVLSLAQSRRCVKSTASNQESSRSHMVFTIHFDVNMKDGIQRHGKLNICDLAGSERLNKSGANNVGGSLLKETQNINSSLSVLSNVIERLQAGDKNVPFRESQLTFLLKNSLCGNSKTLAIVCCNPLSAHYQESIGSLRFADKVGRVEMKAVANFTC